MSKQITSIQLQQEVNQQRREIRNNHYFRQLLNWKFIDTPTNDGEEGVMVLAGLGTSILTANQEDFAHGKSVCQLALALEFRERLSSPGRRKMLVIRELDFNEDAKQLLESSFPYVEVQLTYVSDETGENKECIAAKIRKTSYSVDGDFKKVDFFYAPFLPVDARFDFLLKHKPKTILVNPWRHSDFGFKKCLLEPHDDLDKEIKSVCDHYDNRKNYVNIPVKRAYGSSRMQKDALTYFSFYTSPAAAADIHIPAAPVDDKEDDGYMLPEETFWHLLTGSHNISTGRMVTLGLAFTNLFTITMTIMMALARAVLVSIGMVDNVLW